jgi:hypothetical protein
MASRITGHQGKREVIQGMPHASSESTTLRERDGVGGATRREDLVGWMGNAFGENCRIEDGGVARFVWLKASDHDGTQPNLFAIVLVGPSDGHVHGGIAGTIEQRHHAEADVAAGDPMLEVVVQEAGGLRRDFALRRRGLRADGGDLEFDEPCLARRIRHRK